MVKTKKITDLFILGVFVALMLAVFSQPGGGQAKTARTISFGKIGGDVRQMQIDLSRQGYNLEPCDGVYGLRTRQAVLDLQEKNRLQPTGVFDPATRKVLETKNQTRRGPGEAEGQGPGQANTTARVSRGTSRQDVIILARVVHGEARGEPFEGQVAVASVVLNRTRSGQFPPTINGVVFEPGAFDAVNDGQIWQDPDRESIKAAELALAGYDPTGNAIYYWNPAKTTNRWIWSRPVVTRIGDHVFAR